MKAHNAGPWMALPLFIALICLAGYTHAQLYFSNLNLSNGACWYFDDDLIAFEHTGTPANNSLAIGNVSGYSFRSNGRIVMKDHFKVSCLPGSTGRAIFSATNGDLPVQVLTADYPDAVPIYSKVELGFDPASIPNEDIAGRIEAFLTEAYGILKPGTQDYDDAFDQGLIINPYDPAHISVDLVLYPPSSPHTDATIRYGFFYREFKRIFIQGRYDWSGPSGDFPWRVRFAPDEIGHWAGFLNIWVGEHQVKADLPLSFEVTASDDPGYIGISRQNGAYFTFSGSGEGFIPMGNDYGWPREQWGGCVTANCVNNDDHRMSGTAGAEMSNFVDEVSEYNGVQAANCTRLLFTPWAFSIEREKLNNYDTRQIEMWELDKYLEQLEEAHMRLILGQGEGEFHSGVGDAWPHYNQGWEWNPYHEPQKHSEDPHLDHKGIAGVSTLADFLVDPQAKKFYKARLRYMESRWGYSTALFMYDILNEANKMGADMDDGSNDDANWTLLRPDVVAWCNEMAGYLKNDLKTKHLTAVACGNPGFGGPVGKERLMLEQPNIDVVGAHAYMNREGVSRIYGDKINDLRANDYILKPVVMEEAGTWVFDKSYNCNDIHEHNWMWASLLSGYAGPVMPWSWRRYNMAYTSLGVYSDPPNYGPVNAYYGEYERNFIAQRRFAELLEFDQYGYTYSHSLNSYTLSTTSNQRFETFLARRSTNLIFGWVHNRSSQTYNSPYDCLNQTTDVNMAALLGSPDGYHMLVETPQHTGGGFANEDGYVTVAGFPWDTYEFRPLTQHSIRIEQLPINARYSIEWFYTWGTQGGEIEPSLTQLSTVDAFGRAYFTIPATVREGQARRPGDWAFRATRVKSAAGPTDPEPPSMLAMFDVNRNRLHAFFGGPYDGIVNVYDAVGHQVAAMTVSGVPDLDLDASQLSAGLYHITAISRSTGERSGCSVIISR